MPTLSGTPTLAYTTNQSSPYTYSHTVPATGARRALVVEVSAYDTGFGAVTGVTYNGVPFSQASSAEQIRVSVAMAMAMNPKLRVLRIKDGSLLDDDAMDMLKKLAVKEDFQVWVERVGNGSEDAIVIEAGEVKGAAKRKAAK